MVLENYLQDKYGFSPIILKDLTVGNMSNANLRKQLQKLVEKGVLQRAGRGVYYFPKKIKMLNILLSPPDEKIIERKFIKDDEGNIFGYMTGYNIVNQLGLTTQVPAVNYIVSNKASNDYRKLKIGSTRVILFKPCIEITNENYKILRFLDLLTCMDKYSEVNEKELKVILRDYVKKMNFTFKDVEKFLQFYPDSIYKGLFRAGVLNEAVA